MTIKKKQNHMKVYGIRHIEYNIKENGEKVFVKSWIANQLYLTRDIAEKHCKENITSTQTSYFEYEVVELSIIDNFYEAKI